MDKKIKKYFRECGNIEGCLDGFYPFVWIGRWGASFKEIRQKRSKYNKGLFVVNRKCGDSYTPYPGIIMPISMCLDQAVKANLIATIDSCKDELNRLKREKFKYSGNYLIHKINKLLNKIEMFDLLGTKLSPGDGFIPITITERIFLWIKQNFKMVIQILDNDGHLPVEITQYENILWDNVFEFVSWCNTSFEPWDERISSFSCGIFYGEVGSGRYTLLNEGKNLNLVKYSKESFTRLFELKRNFKPSNIVVRFTQIDEKKKYMYGWIDFIIDIDSTHLVINCSNAYSPFSALIIWLDEINNQKMPVSFNIDEEGEEKTLIAYPTGDVDYLYLQIYKRYDEEVIIDAVLNRKQFIGEVKQKLASFIKTEYNREYWVFYEYEDENIDLLKLNLHID